MKTKDHTVSDKTVTRSSEFTHLFCWISNVEKTKVWTWENFYHILLIYVSSNSINEFQHQFVGWTDIWRRHIKEVKGSLPTKIYVVQSLMLHWQCPNVYTTTSKSEISQLGLSLCL